MGLNIEITWDGPVTIGLLEQFISQAKAAGATSDTTVEEITHEQDPEITLGWRVPATGAVGPPREVVMPHRLMWNIHSMLDQIGSGDGDVRGLQAEINDLDSGLWEALMKHVGQ
ncbi:hypothetical protein PV416_25770 [Streptomyces ipomoeae]|uniref:Uncharacterized protein n=1 Tax=Streptomyces ipomoeae 91-03 TaxID=698759 RepID=L1KT14_9ACTN|nr:hypothetical protein [Streptomyces ipomoeae]EKX63528.1 hypothetical protein STRIP9103_04701 [Streptomyces ipomoeae 91-03]MDX2693149.1 hypothetical protein [Streptomyces ipomoeae]MDX2824410.1 hypothetical protein [Streptomyces ipomoeae]MDX2838635.1 hypothetical protein [Streptomyces ipomoeae]MDX2872318.1 hypothetical protein [Streptomyces ipomoeae]